MIANMKRREFITLLGGAAATTQHAASQRAILDQVCSKVLAPTLRGIPDPGDGSVHRAIRHPHPWHFRAGGGAVHSIKS
jgi:hypothetical protein